MKNASTTHILLTPKTCNKESITLRLEALSKGHFHDEEDDSQEWTSVSGLDQPTVNPMT